MKNTAAFWVTNPNNLYEGNAVAGGSHHGFWYRLLDNPDGPSFTETYCPKMVKMGTFNNNSVHSNGRFGLWIFPGYTPSASGRCNDGARSVARFTRFTSFLNDKGAEWVMSSNLQFRNFVVFDHAEASIETKTIIFNEDPNTRQSYSFYNESSGATIADTVIIGNSDSSSSTSITPTGIIVAWDRGQLIKNVQFYNFPDDASEAMRGTLIAGRAL
jgi:hypothetical protein